MKLSSSPTICPKALLPEARSFARQVGFDWIALFRTWTASSPVHPDFSVGMVRDTVREHDVTLSELNIRNLTGRKADSDERNIPYNLRQLEWDRHIARALGLSSVNIKGGARTLEAMEDLIEGCNRLVDSVPDITLNLGNHVGNRLETLDDLLEVISNLDGKVNVLLDTGHFLSAGQNVIAIAEKFANRIGVVHLRDQKADQPVPFGEGDLPYGSLFDVLNGAGYTGDLVIEMEAVTWANPLEAITEAREFVEDLLGKR